LRASADAPGRSHAGLSGRTGPEPSAAHAILPRMVTTYTVLLTVHVIAAVLWVGGGTMLHVFGTLAMKSGDRARMNQYCIDSAWIGPRMFAPLSLTLLVMGFLLVNEVNYDQSALWIILAEIGWVISFLIGILYYPRSDKARVAVIEAEGLEGAGFLANYRQMMRISQIELLILLLVIVDMTIKPT
jgi:uncharacterized membrane protein